MSGSHVERTEQATRFYYDFNPYDGTPGQNLAGRLAVTETYAKRGGANWNAPGGGNNWEVMTFREMYSYSASGLVLKKRLVAVGRYSPAYPYAWDVLEATYLYDNEGRLRDHQYPSAEAIERCRRTC